MFNEEAVKVFREMMIEGVNQEIAWGEYVIGDKISFNEGICYLNNELVEGNEFDITNYGKNN